MPRKHKMPDKAKIQKMSDKLEKSNSSFILPINASAVDKAKYDICKQIIMYLHQEGLTQRELSKRLGIPETRVSEIVHYHITKFTIDKLLGYYELLNPKVSLKVA